MNLDGKVIIVTGGSGLLGTALIKEIKRNKGIPINLDVSIENENEFNIFCDLTDYASIKMAVEKVKKTHGHLNGLVNNAYPKTKDWGVDFEELEGESLDLNINWQLNSHIMLSKYFILGNSNCSIINIASIYGSLGNDFNLYKGSNIIPPPAYSAIKGGIINFSRYLASKYAHLGIRVNSVSPGGIFDHQDENFVKNYCEKVPSNRMGTPSDIAPAVVFLLSDKSSYITGQNLIIDGGYSII
jgi:NAD(P)-dependent dehydrogenase (short-subunit alcohol dehydrogenase family)